MLAAWGSSNGDGDSVIAERSGGGGGGGVVTRTCGDGGSGCAGGWTPSSSLHEQSFTLGVLSYSFQ